MKKIIVSLLFILVFSLILSPVLAVEKVQTALGRKPENVSSKTGDLENKKVANLEKVRNSIKARWDTYNKLVIRSGQLLDKLQIRIDQVKAAGKDTTSSATAMTDARAKLADARSKMDGLKSLIGTAMDKNSFKDAQTKLQAVHKDLNIVKQDAAKIISNLKSFNSEKSSTKSAEIHSSTSAKNRD